MRQPQSSSPATKSQQAAAMSAAAVAAPLQLIHRQLGSSGPKTADFSSCFVNGSSKYKQGWRSLTADANKVASLEGLGHWSADPANKQGRRSLAADAEKGA